MNGKKNPRRDREKEPWQDQAPVPHRPDDPPPDDDD